MRDGNDNWNTFISLCFIDYPHTWHFSLGSFVNSANISLILHYTLYGKQNRCGMHFEI